MGYTVFFTVCSGVYRLFRNGTGHFENMHSVHSMHTTETVRVVSFSLESVYHHFFDIDVDISPKILK